MIIAVTTLINLIKYKKEHKNIKIANNGRICLEVQLNWESII